MHAPLSIVSLQIVQHHRWKSFHLDALLAHVPGLSESELEKLIVSIGNAATEYQLARLAAKRESLHERAERLRSISRAGRELLALLGLDDPEAAIQKKRRLFARLHNVRNELSSGMAEQAKNRPKQINISRAARITTLVVYLTSLVGAADKILKNTPQESAPTRGGARRRGPTPAGRLVQRAIEAHAASQGGSKPDPKFRMGPELVSFVQIVIALVTDTDSMIDGVTPSEDLPRRLKEAAIRGHLYRLRHKSKSHAL